jgi:hypothetical protein
MKLRSKHREKLAYLVTHYEGVLSKHDILVAMLSARLDVLQTLILNQQHAMGSAERRWAEKDLEDQFQGSLEYYLELLRPPNPNVS